MSFKLNYLVCFFLFCLFVVVSSECEGLDASKGIHEYPKPEANYKTITIMKDVCARLYIPKSSSNNTNKKLPLVVYFHGGGFNSFSAFGPNHDKYVYSVVMKAKIVALSVDYRQGKNYPLPIAYDDSWAAIEWVANHSTGQGTDEWLNNQVDFAHVFFAGDSVGANLAYNMVMRVGTNMNMKLNVTGLALIHPYFSGNERISTTEPINPTTGKPDLGGIWLSAGKERFGLDDPRVNPLKDPKLASLGCRKVLVVIATGDTGLRDRGFYFYEALRTSGWKGKAELMETAGAHDFILYDNTSKNAIDMLERVTSFFNTTS